MTSKTRPPLTDIAESAAIGGVRGRLFPGTNSPYRLPVYLGCTVLAVACSYFFGKDMAFDTLNYQFYAGFSALHDRFGQDYFAAGPQSYFNPYAYVPFYLLASTNLSGLLVCSIFAAAHSIILWLSYELGVAVCPSTNDTTRLASGVCAVALAFVNPILVQQIGSSFADITTAELALFGWLLLVRAVSSPGIAPIVCAGLILGTATGLKLTNAIHAIAGLSMLVMLPLKLPRRIGLGLIFGICVGVGFTVVLAPWGYRLEKAFGNPMFPLLNSVFHSPEFTTEPLRHFRFVPATFAEALWRPFAMIDPTSMLHEELRAPDLRYAVLILLIIAFSLQWLQERFARRSTFSSRTELDVPTRVLVALSCGLAVDWAIWLDGSGNSRYFLPMACVAAALIVGWMFRFFVAQPKMRAYVLAAILGAQVIQLWRGSEFRWNGVPWGGPWFQVAVPQKLANEPALYLTIGTQSNSFIAPFLGPGAGLVNVSGVYALGSDGANGARIKALIHHYSSNLRFLLRGAQLYGGDDRRTLRLSQVNDALERFDLRVDTGDCARITVRGLSSRNEIAFAGPQPVLTPLDKLYVDRTYFVSCRVVPADVDRSSWIPRRQAVDFILDRLEDACPQLFQPRRLRTEHDGDEWRRFYMNTDLVAWVGSGWVKFRDSARGNHPIVLGRESEWVKAPPRLNCGRHDGNYYADVLKSD
jgi:hypothetical protein